MQAPVKSQAVQSPLSCKHLSGLKQYSHRCHASTCQVLPWLIPLSYKHLSGFTMAGHHSHASTCQVSPWPGTTLITLMQAPVRSPHGRAPLSSLSCKHLSRLCVVSPLSESTTLWWAWLLQSSSAPPLTSDTARGASKQRVQCVRTRRWRVLSNRSTANNLHVYNVRLTYTSG